MKEKKKSKKWIKFRHRIVRNLLFSVIYPFSRIKYGIKIERFKEQGKRQYLILFNHQTAFDQFFVGMAFRGPVYYVASEDLFSKGWLSSLIRYLVAPIPIKKQTTDVRAVIDCMRVAKEGGTIALAPEGNRTFSGRTGYMNPAIAPLARKLGMPIALYRLEGGYGVQPRWSNVIRKGKMRGYVSRVIEPEEYKALTDAELMELIKSGLYVDEGKCDAAFYHKRSAEYMERAFYVCPECGLSEFFSEGDVMSCKKCGKRIRYLPTKELVGVGFDFPFRFTTEWYDYQCEFINQLDTGEYTQEPMYTDTASLSEVIVYKSKKDIFNSATVQLYGDRVTASDKSGSIVFPFCEVSAVTVLGRNKVNIYHNKRIYQIKGSPRMNALKYVNTYYRYKNLEKGEINGKFLGL